MPALLILFYPYTMDVQVANGGSWRTVNIAMSTVTAPTVPSQKSMSDGLENDNNDSLRICAKPSYKQYIKHVSPSYTHQLQSRLSTKSSVIH
ncbi:hypothetical protein BGW37DRAFT_500820 [Umbelopsis sp. PMI_123]|nr:hypothetical protein BGW37DRAFT_500820 [Umbelopsis sp. PMI_123]